jgi:hypothetical protein
MRKTLIAASAMLALAVGSGGSAMAAGCLKGAAVGGLAGHMVGHGAVGAAAGCAVGHHEASKTAKQNQAQSGAPNTDQNGSGSSSN